MNLMPHEAGIVRQLLHGTTPPNAIDVFTLLIRLDAEAPPLGEHVFQLVCKLGTDASKEIAENTKARKALREQLGKSRLDKGEGPAKVVPLAAPTLNEYNAMDPWRKEALRKATDKEIEEVKKLWPAWSCGVIERTVDKPGKVSRCKACRGKTIITRKRKEGSVNVTCPTCAGTGKTKGGTQVIRDGGRQRIVVVTRESSTRPDELALDSIGGKIPIDRLVQAGVLRGDSLRWLIRYGTWKESPPGEGRVVVDVYELGALTRERSSAASTA
jgi:hypothetical protein